MRFNYKLFVTLFMCTITLQALSQVRPAAESSSGNIEIGAGFDYWSADYSGSWKYGPAAWASMEMWHGFGVVAEGHSLIGGGLPDYKYVVGEGGPEYTVKRWQSIRPYAKAEAGFAGLSVRRTSTYRSHDTRNTWAAGGGVEYRTSGRVWTRLDYTYDFFPDFLSFITFEKHTLNPNGFTFGMSYHIR